MNPIQRPLENVFKHPPIIMDLAVSKGRKKLQGDGRVWGEGGAPEWVPVQGMP